MTKHITKTGYEITASAINVVYEYYDREWREAPTGSEREKVLLGKRLGVQDTAYFIGTYYEAKDPSFNTDKFRKLCGFED